MGNIIPDVNHKKSSKDLVVNTASHEYTFTERPAVSHPSGIPKPSEKNGLKPNLLESQSRHQTLASIRPKTWTEPTPPSSSQGSPSSTKTASLRYTSDHQASLPKELRFSPDSVKPTNDQYRRELVKHANVSAPLLNGWDLYSHQKRAILKGLVMRRCILALDMGLGKTVIGCVWAKAFSKTFCNLKVIVICPVSLKSEWTKTAKEATGLAVEEDKPRKKKGKGKRSCDSDEDSCDGHPEVVEICSWAKVPNSVEPSVEHYIVICDEAHSMQSMQAGRTKDVLQLALGKKCLGVLLLTGTPMKNGKPSNLFPLLKAVRHPFGKNQKAYEKHFCDGKEKNFGRGRVIWDANGSSNLNQLRELVSSHLLHLTKDECLKDLPPQTRKIRHVPISSRQQLEHSRALSELAKIYDSSSSMENGGEAVLGAVQRVRYVSSCAKVDATVQLAQNLLETTESAVVIFTTFVMVAKSVHKKLEDAGWDGELLTGETPAKKRQSLVDRFQNGLSSVFVCTFGAGGVGLTLTAARTIVLLDRPWTPGDAFQAEDRVRRIGQTKPVQSIWMSAFELDKQIDRVLEQKSKTANAVLSESASSDSNGSAQSPKISIFQLLKNVLPSSLDGRNNQQTSKDGLSQSSLDAFFGETREGNSG